MRSPAPAHAFRASYHRPRFYRYRVADPGLRVAWNRYSSLHGSATIGLLVVVGRYAYCVKWADARVQLFRNRPRPPARHRRPARPPR